MRKIKIILAAALFSPLAWAQQNQQFDQFAPEADSGGVEYMRRVFGGLVDGIMTGQANHDMTLLGSFMSVFGVGAFFLGMLFMVYNSVRGMVDSAESGQFLGKNASSFWLPIRLAIGSALLAPWKSGFSLMQYIVIWLALQGVGMGDQAFKAVLAQFKDTQMIQNPTLPDTRPLISSVLKSQVCAYGMNQYLHDIGSSDRVDLTVSESSFKTKPPILNWFEKSKQVVDLKWEIPGEDSPSCGGISWQRGSVFDSDTKVVQQELLDGHHKAVFDMINKLNPVARDFASTGDKTQLKLAVLNAEREYNRDLQALAVKALAKTNEGAMDDFVKKADTLGFMYAGMWLGHLNEWNNATQQALNAIPVSRPLDLVGRYDPASLQTVSDLMVKLDSIAMTTATTTQQIFENGEGLPEPDSPDAAANWINKFTLGLTSATLEGIGGGTMSHLTNLRDFGDNLLIASQAAMIGTGVAAGKAGSKAAEYTIGLGFSPLHFLKQLSGPVTFAVIGMMTLGVTLSVYLILMPLIAWIIAVLNWLIAVIEAVIAAPLFAAAHMHPDGDERIGNAGEGYRMLLNVIMRPSLMVAGILVGFILVDTIMGFVNEIFMPYIRGAQNGSVVGLVKYIGIVTAYVMLAMSIMNNCFSMVHLLPDRVMLYMGRSIAGLGGSERVESEMKAGVSTAGGQIQTAGVSAIKSSAERTAQGDERSADGGGKRKEKESNGLTM